MNDILVFDDVLLKFGKETIYDGLSFTVKKGEFLCILGPSGCGKSTSLRLMGNLLEADDGNVTIEGLPPEHGWNKLAYVFQSPRLVPWRSALGNVLLGMELRFEKLAKSTMAETANRLLDMVGLHEDKDKYPGMLSGGERQRAAVARALITRPKLVLADEPTGNLDAGNGAHVLSLMLELNRELETSLVVVTHDHSIAQQMDRIKVLRDGKLNSE